MTRLGKNWLISKHLKAGLVKFAFGSMICVLTKLFVKIFHKVQLGVMKSGKRSEFHYENKN